MPLDCLPDQKPCPKCQVSFLDTHYGFTPQPHHQLGTMDLCLHCGWFDNFEPDNEGMPAPTSEE